MLVVSPDVTVVTLTRSLNVTIPAGMTIAWLHNDSVVLTITTQVEQTSNTVTLQMEEELNHHMLEFINVYLIIMLDIF